MTNTNIKNLQASLRKSINNTKDLIDWREAESQKRKYGGWENLVTLDPEFSFNAYMQLGIADLGKTFVKKYSDSSDVLYSQAAQIIAGDLPNLENRGHSLNYVGSTSPDTFGTTEMNWRDSNVWDLGIRKLEDSSL